MTETGGGIPKEDSSISIDDAAMLFIQIEPNDLSGLARLEEMLEKICASELYPESAQENILKAVGLIEAIILKKITDRNSAVAEIGGLLQKAINANDANGKTEKGDAFAADK